MSPPLTPDQAADLYRNLLDDVLAVTAEFSRGLGLDPVVAVHPPEACGEMSGRVVPAFRVVAQRGRHLGERMAWAAREAGAAGARRILLRGSDSPLLPDRVLLQALRALDDHDLAVSPDRDGGYSLIALRKPCPGLFDHAMSTQSVLEDTLANARRLGLRPHVLPPSFDLDTAEDFLCLAEARARGCANLCPRTLAFLDKNDLWGQ